MSSLFYWEIILLAGYCLVILLGGTPILLKWQSRIDELVAKIYTTDWMLILIPGMISLFISIALSLFIGWPEPRVHDEFSYLLASDTFSLGRLSNPPHPCWMHFETFHVLQQPYYLSKYPPGQGLCLAFGQTLFQSPIMGVWISLGLASSALAWMLRVWFPPRVVFWVSVMSVIQLNILGHMMPTAHYGYWGQSYWGGAVAALGGFLSYGAWGRLRNVLSWKFSVILGIGVILLANSRPYEGLLAMLPIMLFITRDILLDFSIAWQTKWKHFLFPLGLSLALLMTWMLVYNQAGTGSCWDLPFQKYEKTYAIAPLFLTADLRPVPQYHHRIMKDFYLEQMLPMYLVQKQWKGLCVGILEKIKIIFDFYFNPLLFVPTVFFFFRKKRFDVWIFLTVVAVVVGFLIEVWILPHYAAPFCGLFYVGLAYGIQLMANYEGRGERFFKCYPAILPGLLCCALLLPLNNHLGIPVNSWRFIRSNIENDLGGKGRHLILVQYAPNHPAAAEWVYNKADINQSPMVWARSMGWEKDQRLIQFFKERKAWILRPDQFPVQLIPVIP
jgi:hypothetical protein